MKVRQQEMFQPEESEQPLRIFTDGAGARPDGKGSGYGFLRTDTGEKQVTREDGLTNNQAEYKGIILALESLPRGTVVEVCTDSEVICAQLNRTYSVRNPKLALLWNDVQEVIQRKSLKTTFVWVPRQENPAGKLL
jgi:ribonuclease HI